MASSNQNPPPLVSVSMICYNAELFIAEAIEGVLAQDTSFPLELVIGDDCSSDGTRAILEAYAAEYPGLIRLLPKGPNLGITGNTARNFAHCRGKYIAICDGDDIWVDPFKLKKQVEFLESNPEYGLSYSDVEPVSETGAPIQDPDTMGIRKHYTDGKIFFKLLQGNFINNSTVVFRRKYLENHVVLPTRSYQIQDYVTWLHIAACGGKGHFLPTRTTKYRRHSNSLSINVPWGKKTGNRRMLRFYLYKAVANFDRLNKQALSTEEKTLLFRRMLSLLFRKPGTMEMKMEVLLRMPKYYPGFFNLIRLGFVKVEKGFSSFQLFKKTAYAVASINLFFEEFGLMASYF